jgi:Flp pilus assembly protein TadD
MNSRMRLSWVLLLTLVFGFCFDLAAQMKGRVPRPSTVKGQLRMADGTRAPENLDVELEMTGGGAVAHVRTDALGKFEFTGLLPEVYYVRISHPDYHEIFQRVDLTMSSTGFVNADLRPIARRETPSVPPEGPDAAVDVSPIPEKARKEYSEGQQKMASGDPKSAVAHFRKAAEHYPQYAEAYYGLGTAYLELGDAAETKAALQKTIELQPNHPMAHLLMGTTLMVQKDLAGAEQSLLKAVQLMPDAMEAHYELSRVYFALNRNDDAEFHGRKAVALKPDHAAAHVVLGNIFLRKREFGGALLEYQQYLRLEPDGPMSAGVRDMVGKLEKQASND